MLKVARERTPGVSDADLVPASRFVFSALRDELCVGGVYLRIFIKTGDIGDIDDPSQFCRDLMQYLAACLDGGSADRPAREFMEYAVESLKVLAEPHEYIAGDVAGHPPGIDLVFDLLAQPCEGAAFASAARLLVVLCSAPVFVAALCEREPPVMWRLLRVLCTATGPSTAQVWAAAEAVASHPDGLESLLAAGGSVRMLACIFGIRGHVSAYQSRLSAVSLLSKFLWNPAKGPEASNMLRRFLPEPVVLLLRSKAGNASLQVLDDVCENPEMIWTSQMQGELRAALTALVETSPGAAAGLQDTFPVPPSISPEYAVHYQQLAAELYVGGVYIRLFLKQPTFRLSNPVFFLEKLVEFWESAFNTQVPLGSERHAGEASDSRAVVLGSEDFLSLLTSSIVCVVKSEQSVLDHLLSWGFAHNLCDLLQRAVTAGRRGAPVTSIMRLLHQLIGRVDAVDNLASAPVDIVRQVTRALGGAGAAAPSIDGVIVLPREAAIYVELLKRIFQSRLSQQLGHFVQMAMQADLPNFLLSHVIGAPAAACEQVRSAPAMRIHAVDLVKAIIAADEFAAAPLQALLDAHPAWAEFRDQSHDLFITVRNRLVAFPRGMSLSFYLSFPHPFSDPHLPLLSSTCRTPGPGKN